MYSWTRTHKNPEVRALIVAQPSTVDYIVSIIEPVGERRVPHNYWEKTPERAKAAADSLVQIHYRHNCRDSGCGEWEQKEAPSL